LHQLHAPRPLVSLEDRGGTCTARLLILILLHQQRRPAFAAKMLRFSAVEFVKRSVAVGCGVCEVFSKFISDPSPPQCIALNGSVKVSRTLRAQQLARSTPTATPIVHPALAAMRTPSSASMRSGVGHSPSSASSSAVAASAGGKVRSQAVFTSPSTPYSPAPLSARGVAATVGFGAGFSTPSSAKKKKNMSLEAAVASSVTSGSASTVAAAAGVFGANAGKGGLFSSLNQIFGGSLR
jgi:hypothetical protein